MQFNLWNKFFNLNKKVLKTRHPIFPNFMNNLFLVNKGIFDKIMKIEKMLQ